MKSFYITALFFLISTQAMAREYICHSDSNEKASLVRTYKGNKETLQWSEANEASSKGVFIGIDQAPYDMTAESFRIYTLSDFYKSEDSDFRLALGAMNGKKSFFFLSISIMTGMMNK